MGGKSSETQQQTQSASPWGPASGLLGGLMSRIGNQGPAPDRTGMVSDAYSGLQSNLAPTVGGQFLDPNSNPFFSRTTQTIGDDVQNRLSGLYAGSGRDPAGAGNFGGNLARGIAEGTAPAFAGQYNAERQNQLGAMGSLFQGGGATAGLLSGLDQIPLQQLLAQLGGVLGPAQAFGTQTGTAQKESQMSGTDQFFKLATGVGSLFGGGKKS